MTINTRDATGTEVLSVDFADRVISLVVVPYDEVALVPHNGEIWEESFSRSAFDHLDPHHVVRVNREHDRTRTVGRVIHFDTRDPRGLVADIKIARTPLGDETLQLASEDCLSASIGFGVDPQRGVITDRVTRTRRIISAIIDHVAVVEQPAYAGARVLAVRSSTPHLDAFRRDRIMAWAEWRTDPVMVWARRRTRGSSR